MTDVDCAVVGAGAVGLACAARLARAGCSVLVVERLHAVGQETSSRNSGVIHAGLYYPVGSHKAQTCVEGRKRLYAWCQAHNVPHHKVGKLLVATDDAECERLAQIQARAYENGAGRLPMVSQRELGRREPEVEAVAGLWSPETGIVDAHALMDSYKAVAVEHGAELCFVTEVEAIERDAGGFRVHTRSPQGGAFTLSAATVVNAAGLSADRIAERAGIDVDALGYRLHFCKGDYFALAPALRGIVKHLVYPVPVSAGLGIHITMDLGGKLTAGPDTEYVETLDYRVDPTKASLFGRAVRRYLPRLRDEDLTPDYAGMRPKLQAPGEPVADFVIEEASAHGCPGLVNLIGIESPGLTASLAIAEHVARLLGAGRPA